MCGITSLEDINTINELLPEYVGFVFYEKSKRYITPDKAKELKLKLDKRIQAVGVFLHEKAEAMAALASDGVIDMIQAHGCEEPEFVREIKKLTDVPVIQAFKTNKKEDILRAVESPAEYILVDSSLGSGEMMDIEILKDFPRPFFLAGGLDPENVSTVIDAVHPEVVDVSSGIETDGKKDPEKMRAFMQAVKGTQILCEALPFFFQQ